MYVPLPFSVLPDLGHTSSASAASRRCRIHHCCSTALTGRNRNEVSFKTIMLTRFEITKDIPIPTAKARIRGWLKLTKDERKLLIDLKQENMGPFYEKFEFWNETEHRRAGAAVQRIIDRQKRLAGVDQGVDDYGELQEGNDIRKQDEDEGLDVQGGCAWWNMDALKVSVMRQSWQSSVNSFPYR